MIRKLMVIVLGGVICLLGASIVLAQVQYNSLEEYEKATGEEIEKFNEAPMLMVKVAVGELPSVGERLPEEPIVIKPLEEIGQYGGTLYFHVAGTGVGLGGDSPAVIGREGVLGLASDYITVVPNIATGWEFSKDGKSLTLYLRKGIKWSDGAPFTADDFLFWYEDIILNDELTPAKPAWMTAGGELMKIEKIDDYTVRLNFAVTSPLMLQHLSHQHSGFIQLPKHYMKQFHPRYTPIEELEEMAKKEGFDYWYQLFQERGTVSEHCNVPLTNPDLPVLGTFMLKERGVESWTLERNPYYWKVDTAGNQLPYIDRILVTVVANMEMLNAKIVTGENDLAVWVTGMQDYTLYKENAEKGGYRVLLYSLDEGNKVQYFFNQTVEDPILRKIFRDVRFRRAMSLAIDREEIVEAGFLGYAVPVQVTNNPGSAWYEPEFAEAYAQYDPNESNRLLDEIGLKWDKNHEYRLRPDAKRLTVTLEYFDAAAEFVAVNELVREQWKKVGFDLILKGGSGSLLMERNAANKLQVSQMAQTGGDYDFFTGNANCFIPMSHGWITDFAPLWTDWYLTKGEKGEEPPEEIKKNIERWERMRVTMDDEERIRLGKEILASQAENLWTIGTVGMPAKPCVVKNNLRNVPEKAMWGWESMCLIPHHPETFFFKQK